MTKDEVLKIAQDACPYFDEISKGAFYEGFITAFDQFRGVRKLIEPDVGIDRGAWSDVPDATKWVDELRGDEQPEQEVSYTDIQIAELIMSDCGHSSDYKPLLDRIAGRLATYRQALEQPPNSNTDVVESEPVAWCELNSIGEIMYFDGRAMIMPGKFGNDLHTVPLYAAPPKREWVGLTDEEIQDFGYEAEKFDKSNSEWFDRFSFARAIEAKLKEKNRD